MSDNVVNGVIEEVVKDLVEDVTMFLEIQDDDDEPPAKKPRVENGTNEQNGLSRNVLASNSTYPQGRMNTPSPLARRREPRRTDYPGEDRPGTLLSSYVPAPGHIAMVHPLHNVIIEVPQDLPILLQGPAISEENRKFQSSNSSAARVCSRSGDGIRAEE